MSIFINSYDLLSYFCSWEPNNPFPHIDAFWRLCSRRPFENVVTREEIAQNVQFLLLPQMFSTFCHRLSIQLWRFSIFLKNTFKVVCCRIAVWGKGLSCTHAYLTRHEMYTKRCESQVTLFKYAGLDCIHSLLFKRCECFV